jgi:hypothetical protein
MTARTEGLSAATPSMQSGWKVVSKLTTLHLTFQCSEQVFIKVLKYLILLQELVLSIAYPSPSWQNFLESLAAKPSTNDWPDGNIRVVISEVGAMVLLSNLECQHSPALEISWHTVSQRLFSVPVP